MSDNIGLSRQFPLLRLPPEVRMMVYDLLWYIPNEDWDGWESRSFPGEKHFPPALSSVCEEIAQECLPIYIGKCHLDLHLDINSPTTSE